MEGLGAGILDDPANTERLAALREQRMLLRELRDDVELAVRMVVAADLDGSWRSAAQRGYAQRLGELRDELRSAWHRLDDAIDAAHASISRLTASG